VHDQMPNKHQPWFVSWPQTFVGHLFAWSMLAYLLLLVVDTLTSYIYFTVIPRRR
jgi:hypothetical protein